MFYFEEQTVTLVQVLAHSKPVIYSKPSLPEQTSEEMERTRQFSLEVVDLLKHSPQCRMPFNKFIPSYHHHFSKQCRVSDYGFTKLIELFESIPDIVQVRHWAIVHVH
jgi:hypothetical protein